MPDLSDGEFAKVIERVLEDAERREQDAAFGGEHHDGGASRMRSEVEMFRSGMNRQLPPEWLPVVRQIRQEDNPEWAEYQRLRDKFESI